MSFQGQHVVVIGATGVIASGVVSRYLDAGATVIGVSRSGEKLDRLRQQLKIGPADRFRPVIGDFADERSSRVARQAVSAALGGAPIDHLLSAQGFLSLGKSPTQDEVELLRRAFDDGLYNNLRAAQIFLPELKSRAGSSFTLVSGGLAHTPPPVPSLWMATMKNAALNALELALATETQGDAVRVNTLCIHFSVAPMGGSSRNQLGMPAEGDTLRLAPAFLAVAGGTQKGKLLCLGTWADAERLAEGAVA